MGYYDFNDHFWSPTEVCAIAPKAETQKRFLSRQLLNMIFRKIFRRCDNVQQRVR